MSILKTSTYGWFISHEKFSQEIYKNVDNSPTNFQIKPELFKIFIAYKNSKNNRENNDDSSLKNEVNKVLILLLL